MVFDQPEGSGALADAAALAGAVLGTIRMAESLVVAERAVDLTGLDNMAGLLCARALDLPDRGGRALRPDLCRIVAALDRLAAVLVPSGMGP